MSLTTAQVVGGASIVTAVLGIAATLVSVRNVVRARPEQDPSREPFFHRAFFLFSAVSIVFNVLLGFVSIALLVGFSVSWWQFLGLFAVPAAYVLVLGGLWRSSSLGPSIAAATGLGNI